VYEHAVESGVRSDEVPWRMQAGPRAFVADEELAVDVQLRTVVAVDGEGVVSGIAARD